jgi:hypothetical protein
LFWKISDLSEVERMRLEDIGRGQNLEGHGPTFWVSKYNSRILIFGQACGLVALAIPGGILLFNSLSSLEQTPLWLAIISLGLTALLIGWNLVLAREWFQVVRSPIRPFLLVTSKAALRCDYAHGDLEAYVLKEAKDFSSADTYGTRSQNFTGRVYKFTFKEGLFVLTIKANEQIQQMEKVLALARAGSENKSDVGLSLLPSVPGRPKGRAVRDVTNPYGTFWIATAGFLFAGAVFAWLGTAIFGSIFGK